VSRHQSFESRADGIGFPVDVRSMTSAALFLLCAFPLAPSADTHYVWTNSPLPSAPYTNWSTAAHVIHDAIAAAGAGDVVVVTNGTYVLTNTVSVGPDMVLCSVNGAELTTLVGSGQHRCVYAYGAGAVIEGLTITGGRVDVFDGGAGAYLHFNTTIRDCVLVDNESVGRRAGALYLESSALAEGCTIISNRASVGGGVYCYGTLTDSTLAGNTATGQGGGGFYGCGPLCRVEHCTIRDNDAPNGAGGLFLDAGIMRNCLVVDNHAESTGGGMYFVNGGPSVFNCTVVGNTAGLVGGGLGSSNDAWRDTRIGNTIIWSNEAANPGVANVSTIRATEIFTHSCSTPLLPGTANLTNDPAFARFAQGDYALSRQSLCINGGTNQPWMVGAVDRGGHARVINGVVDIGVHEYTGSVWRLEISAEPGQHGVPLPHDYGAYDRPGSHLKTVNNTPRRHALALSHIAL